MFIHQVVGGRLYLFDPGALDEITKRELNWAAGEAKRLPAPSFRWGRTQPSPPKPPIGVNLRGFRPGHPDPQDVSQVAQSARQEQVLRIQNAKSLFEQRPQRFLGANGTIWVVDGQQFFVREPDRELNAAIQARLAQGDLQGPPPTVPQPLTPPVRFYRVLPVGDTR